MLAHLRRYRILRSYGFTVMGAWHAAHCLHSYHQTGRD
jgi:hypothetical protein